MDKEIKRLARKNYIKYFRVWFILVGIALAVNVLLTVVELLTGAGRRGNDLAPEHRVYDYADVLTSQEEEELELYIAENEKTYQIDLVLVTISEDIEGEYSSWDYGMRNLADDFYDENNFGYNKVHGDGALLLDNWYDGQEGSWLSTCGSVYQKFGDDEINSVLRAVYNDVESNPFEAYKAYVDETCLYMTNGLAFIVGLLELAAVFVPFIYAFGLLHQTPAKDTTKANTYVVNGVARQHVHSDRFLRKSVSKRIIETGSSGGGGSHGGGGGHVSSGGVSHGGGGMRR